MSRIFPVLLAIYLASTCAAQEAGPDSRSELFRVRELLRSPDPARQAQAAHMIARCRMHTAGDDLAGALNRIVASSAQPLALNSPEYWLTQTIADALVELRYSADASLLSSLYRIWPRDEVIILLGQHAEANREALLSLWAPDLGDAQWLAIGNLVSRFRSPAFASTVLRSIKAKHTICVTDGETGLQGIVGSIGIPVWNLKLPEEFPEIAIYRLMARGSEGDVLLGPGAQPVYYRRQTVLPSAAVTWPKTDWIGVEGRHPALVYFLKVLSQLPPAEVDRAFTASTVIRWTNTASFRAQARNALAVQVHAILNYLETLRQAGLLDSAEIANIEIPVELRIGDERRHSTAALPRITSPVVRLVPTAPR